MLLNGEKRNTKVLFLLGSIGSQLVVSTLWGSRKVSRAQILRVGRGSQTTEAKKGQNFEKFSENF
jgi:hypothetical protein